MNIQDSVVLVTGANRGIGKALVGAFKNAGAHKIYATARDINTLPDFGDRVIPVTLDITKEHSITSLKGNVQDITILINNAGVLSFGDIFTASNEQWRHAFDVNFYGTLNMTNALTPVIEQNSGGSIINILTLLSFASMPGMAAYNASKAAAWNMTQSLRATLKSKHIDVHSVFPGAVDTDMLAAVEMPKTAPADVAKAIIEGVITGDEDIFPDPMSKEIYGAWKNDHKAIERNFAQM